MPSFSRTVKSLIIFIRTEVSFLVASQCMILTHRSRPCIAVIRLNPGVREPLKDILNIYHIYTPELEEFLHAMLRILPAERLTAKQLLELPWLKV